MLFEHSHGLKAILKQRFFSKPRLPMIDIAEMVPVRGEFIVIEPVTSP